MSKNRFDFDKVEWQWKSAAEIYCKEFNKSSDQLTEDDHSAIWECGANHIAFF